MSPRLGIRENAAQFGLLVLVTLIIIFLVVAICIGSTNDAILFIFTPYQCRAADHEAHGRGGYHRDDQFFGIFFAAR